MYVVTWPRPLVGRGAVLGLVPGWATAGMAVGRAQYCALLGGSINSRQGRATLALLNCLAVLAHMQPDAIEQFIRYVTTGMDNRYSAK